MNTWVLLERTPNLLPRLFGLISAPKLSMLFDATELAPYTDQSPILIACDDRSKLLNAVQQTPEDWPGLILRSEQSSAMLLNHLRQILFVLFDGNRRGVLRFSHPVTASYFFPACLGPQLTSWLGPVTQLSWYGGTWPDRASNACAWKTLENPKANSAKAFASDPVLDADQQHALRCQQHDHFLYQWWLKQSDLSFSLGQQWLDEALRYGFTEVGSLEIYLNMRFVYPDPDLPPALPEGSDETRLAFLKCHLQKPSTGQES